MLGGSKFIFQESVEDREVAGINQITDVTHELIIVGYSGHCALNTQRREYPTYERLGVLHMEYINQPKLIKKIQARLAATFIENFYQFLKLPNAPQGYVDCRE